MSVLQRFVLNGSSPGGTGLNNSESGTDRAYSSASEAEANEQASFNGDRLVVTIGRGTGGDDTTFLYIDGSSFTTSADYMTWEAGAGDEAVKTGIDGARYTLAPGTADVAITIGDQYVRIKGLQVVCATTGIRDRFTPANTEIFIDSCFIDVDGNDQGIEIGDADTTAEITNNIIIGPAANFRNGILCSNGVVNAYNNIVYNMYYGLRQLGGTFTATNNTIFGSGAGGDANGTFTADHNASDSGFGTNAQTIIDPDLEFSDYVNGDFTPLDTGVIYQNGIAISGLTIDMSGNTWNDPPTIGANEYVSGVTPVSPNDLTLSSIILEQTKATPTIIADDLILSSIILESPGVEGVVSPNDLVLSAIILQETAIGGTVSPDDLILSSIILESPGVSGIISPDNLVLSSIILEQAIIIPSVIPDNLVLSAIILEQTRVIPSVIPDNLVLSSIILGTTKETTGIYYKVLITDGDLITELATKADLTTEFGMDADMTTFLKTKGDIA